MQRPRFTMRQMIVFFTILVILIATLIGIEKRRVKATHDAYVRAYRLNREAIESRRDELSPGYYETTSRELDAEAIRLGIKE